MWLCWSQANAGTIIETGSKFQEWMMQLGIGSYTYGWSSGTYGSDDSQQANLKYLTAYDLIDKAVALDVPVVQLCVKPDLAQDAAWMNCIDDPALRRLQTARRWRLARSAVTPDHLLRFLERSPTRWGQRSSAPSLPMRLARATTTSARHIGGIAGQYADEAGLSGNRKSRSVQLSRSGKQCVRKSTATLSAFVWIR